MSEKKDKIEGQMSLRDRDTIYNIYLSVPMGTGQTK